MTAKDITQSVNIMQKLPHNKDNIDKVAVAGLSREEMGVCRKRKDISTMHRMSEVQNSRCDVTSP